MSDLPGDHLADSDDAITNAHCNSTPLPLVVDSGHKPPWSAVPCEFCEQSTRHHMGVHDMRLLPGHDPKQCDHRLG